MAAMRTMLFLGSKLRNTFARVGACHCLLLISLSALPALGGQAQDSPKAHAGPVSPPKTGATPSAAVPKPAPHKALASQPLLPPITHDFTSLLSSPTENATAAQLKNIVAFVSSDKDHSYPATVQTLAPDYAIVTNPIPAGETAVSVLIGSKDGGKPSVAVPLAFTEVTKSVVVSGDFSAVTSVSMDLDCGQSAACAVLLAADGQTSIGHVTALRISPDQISVTYAAPPAAAPVSIRIQDPASHYPIFSFVPSKTPINQEQVVSMRQVLTGDFCQKDERGDCSTELFKPASPSRQGHSEDPHFAVNPIIGKYLVQSGDSQFRLVQLNALGLDTADISFSAPASFKPAYLVLDTANQSYRFAYTPAPPVQTSALNYASDEMSSVCNLAADPLDATKQVPDCDHTPPDTFVLKSLSGGDDPGYIAMQANLVVARITAPLGQEPAAIVISNKTTRKSTIARRTTKPGGDSTLLNVAMTIMDQVTTQRNYGNRIAKRYVAVTLDVRNPTATKVQFNKSAMYFDVDYVEAKEQGMSWTGFVQGVAEVSTLGLYQPSVYNPPFVAGRRDKQTPRVARFGLEQNVQQSPENYLSVLGSFDYTTTKTDEKLKALELVGSVLTNIATGGVVADASGAFRAGASLFSGTFLPGVRGIVLDTSFINRLRSNLVAQTMQETIQVPAKGSATTIVLLPRTGILAFTDAQVPVMIQRVIDVHLVEEVVNSAIQTAVKKNQCTTGNSKDQTRQALGEPTGTTTNPDGSSSFTFSAGPVASADFDTKGLLVSCKSRAPTEQMDLAKTLVEAKQILTDLGINATQIALTDGSTVLVDIPGIAKTYHFDAKGALTSEYTFLFKDITSEEGKTQTDFQTFLVSKAAILSATRSSMITEKAISLGVAKAGSSFPYDSPDIQNGSMTVTFKNSGTGKSVTVVVDKVTFQGDQPKSTN